MGILIVAVAMIAICVAQGALPKAIIPHKAKMYIKNDEANWKAFL
jgi:hypothetical protein